MKDLGKTLEYWLEILSLKNWEIKVQDNCVGCEFENVAYGECTYDLTRKFAIIKLLDEKYVAEDAFYKYDKEQTLVHELLRCKFALIGDSGNDIVDRVIHQLVNDFACALIKVKRDKEIENGGN